MSKAPQTICKKRPDDIVIALVGSPNVGKTTLFNALTGRNQHTGNWAGKTVSVSQGRYTYKGKNYILVDLPGTYSLLSQSEEEQITIDFLSSGTADCTLIVVDAICFERNLSFAMQVMQQTKRAALCINLMDEAEDRGIHIDFRQIQSQLGIPVVGTASASGDGLEQLQEMLRNLSDGFLSSTPSLLIENEHDYSNEPERRMQVYAKKAAEIVRTCVAGVGTPKSHPFDRIALGRWSGRLLMLMLLFAVFWITMIGANYPSQALQNFFDAIGALFRGFMHSWPQWITGLLIDGIYGTTANVISVMLPPLLIFFPAFTLLEDLGYLPRVAFLMDHSFERCGSCGKQVLTMSMGFGCNTVGVMGCRIISSPRERMLAILTNSLVPCNGRFPALLALTSLLFPNDPLLAAIALTAFILLAIGMTLLCTSALSHTVLRGKESHFVLEIPPYRRPKLKKLLTSAIVDKTLFVIERAAMVAAPTGAVIWGLQHITYHETSLLQHLSQLLDPIGFLLGMSGSILLAFILSYPANELLLPLIVLTFNGSNSLSLADVFHVNGWTRQIALCTLVFALFHWPCSTTCLTIFRETRSVKTTLAAIALPTIIGVLLCFIISRC